MINPNKVFRKAIFEAIGAIPFKTGNVYAFEEELIETGPRKKLVTDVAEYYIILLNQTANDNSSKCGRNDALSIQIQCTSVFKNNKGGSLDAETISELVMDKLFPDNIGIVPSPTGTQLWKLNLDSVRNIQYNEVNSKTWITQLIVTAELSQL